jgi:hypothetical protein
MRISALIKELEKIKRKHGDVPVKVQTLTHVWDPELSIKGKGMDVDYVLLNS